MSYPPPEPPDSSQDPDEESEEPTTPVALVSTLEPLPVRISEIDDDRMPEGMVCMGSFIDGRLIARSAVPPDMIHDIEDRDMFADPVRIALAAIEQDPGLQCRLFALLPAEQFQDLEDEAEEPWADSVPKFEEAETTDSGDGEAVVPLLLGHIVRFAKDRKHPEDLAAEAADVLQTILADGTPLSSVVDKILEDLLDSE